MKVSYYLLNPTQNITVLCATPVPVNEQVRVASRLMELEPTAEQVGFVNGEKLRMAGGEFCGNASMSAAALFCKDLAAGEKRKVELSVSGADGKITVDITAENDGSFTGAVSMPVPLSVGVAEINFNGKAVSVPAVKFSGITHLIFDSTADKKAVEKSVPEWCAELGADALGVMLLNEEKSQLTPLVYVPQAGTMFWENSCASGTSAVGAYLFSRENMPISCTLEEPGGKLSVEADGKSLRLTGNVKIIKQAETEI